MMRWIRNTHTQILLLSSLILFLELALMRFLSAYIIHLAYFSNLILIGTFFGIGLGSLLSGKKSVFKFFPYTLLTIVLFITWRFNVYFQSQETVYFQAPTGTAINLPFWFVAPTIFFLVSLPFIGLGQKLGELFKKTEPLKGYTYDVIGSISGILLFTAVSFLGTSPVVWFSIILILYLTLLINERLYGQFHALLVFAVIIFLILPLTKGTYWSPYYKISVFPHLTQNKFVGYDLTANETGHQTLWLPVENNDGWIYFTPYNLLNNPSYKNVLVIGAGGGTDVALALKMGAVKIDAVDIDPTIVSIGKRLHPAQPYSDPRVSVTVADGRNFLENNRKKYDLIIFALTDSLALASSYANTRLESYLFTKESFELARKSLSQNGLLVFYNYYRERWLVDKLSATLKEVFNQNPVVKVGDSNNYLGSILIGPKLSDLKTPQVQAESTVSALPSPSDDWPFLYLKNYGFPKVYLYIIATILTMATALIFFLSRGWLNIETFPWHFFFLGSGFLLLETKNVINFQLLFGSTWIVNTLVFVAVLTMVLFGTLLTRRQKPSNKLNHLYLALLTILLLNIFIPLRTLSGLPLWLKYFSAATLTLSPIFFANLIFTRSFRPASSASVSIYFAANLLGSMFGGFSEYASMFTGYHYIAVLTIFFYVASWLTKKQ